MDGVGLTVGGDGNCDLNSSLLAFRFRRLMAVFRLMASGETAARTGCRGRVFVVMMRECAMASVRRGRILL